MSIEEAITDYLLDIEIRKYSPRTIQSYKQKLKRLTVFCEEIGVDDMDDLTMSHIKQFSQKMIQKGNKGSYINFNTSETCLFCVNNGFNVSTSIKGKFSSSMYTSFSILSYQSSQSPIRQFLLILCIIENFNF